MKLNTIDISMLDDFKIGNAEDRGRGTGCTVIVSEDGAVGGADVRGGGPATVGIDILKGSNLTDKINAVVLSGGSVFGLEAASGVTRALADHGVGYKLGDIVIPMVCGASLFDLNVGDHKAFPDVDMGKEAARNAFNGKFRSGNSGAGTGATVGKTRGMSKAMKSGLGTFACGDGSLEVGAVVAVNAMGDVYNGAGNIIAGLRSEDGNSIYGTIRTLKEMVVSDAPKRSGAGAEITEKRAVTGSLSRVEHRARMREVARAIKEEFRKTDQYKKEEILEADRKFKEEKLKQERLKKEALAAAEAEPVSTEDQAAEVTAEVTAEEIPVMTAEQEVMILTEIASESEAPEEPKIAAEPAPGPQIPSGTESAEASEAPEEKVSERVQSFIDEEHIGKHMKRGEPEYDDDDEEDEEETETDEASAVTAEHAEKSEDAEKTEHAEKSEDAEKQAIDDFLDEFRDDPEEDGDLGYDIPFNTTIGCLITNAKLTRAQANKLASILHDAYARAIKPVHSTYDGDTVFVLASGKCEVNFDAFAALATDVMQYAVIDAATSAKSAYGLPSASDFAARR